MTKTEQDKEEPRRLEQERLDLMFNHTREASITVLQLTGVSPSSNKTRQ